MDRNDKPNMNQGAGYNPLGPPGEPTLGSAYRPSTYDPTLGSAYLGNGNGDSSQQVSGRNISEAGPSHRQTPPSSSNKRPSENGGSGVKEENKKKKTNTAASNTSPKKEGDSGEQPRRAAQACLRCRRQKLRCLGGYPCNRCVKSKNVCDFGKPGFGPVKETGSEANARLEQLESSVANLLAGLAGGPAGGQYPNGEMLHQFGDMENPDGANAGNRRQSSFSSEHRPSWAPALPPPTHIRPLDPPRFGPNPLQPSLSPDDPTRAAAHVRFSASPGNPLLLHGTSPSNYTSSGFGQTPDDNKEGGPSGGQRKGKGENPEERLAAAEDSLYEAPFKALLHQPSLWDNREQSRRNSLDRSLSQPQSRDELSGLTYDRRLGREKDDPINTGLVDLPVAEALFQFFIDHCHPFLPIVNVALDDAFTIIRQSPPLISAMLAIAARFYVRYTNRFQVHGMASYPVLDPSTPPRLANLAESHLAQTMLRKQHALSDVQAILLLAAWGLQPGGRGPDAWIVTGHAARIARRLGVHKVLAQAADTSRITTPGSEEWEKLEAFLPQWRTWLCWFGFDGFLSLGFGRPQSTQFETVDESGFLQIRMNQPLPRPGSTASVSLSGDVYIAGQVQLTQIGRDLINWGDMLTDPEKAVYADPRRAAIFKDRHLSVTNMFKELNSRLDEWSRMWVYTGSPYSLYLGSSARIARLQAEHMRLCLNSYALKAGSDTDEAIGQCLKKALNAAMSSIQTHFEASQTDLALSFATDYLTITLAQAAVFLVRITKAPESVQAVVNVEHSVIAHYLKMSVDLLESSDLSETRLATYLAKTIRDISRAAGIPNIGPPVYDDPPEIIDSRPHTTASYPPPVVDAPDGESASGSGFDLENFLQIESQLDLGYLLGLPGDNGAQAANSGALNYGSGGFMGEFGFGMGGMGVGNTNGFGVGNGMNLAFLGDNEQ